MADHTLLFLLLGAVVVLPIVLGLVDPLSLLEGIVSDTVSLAFSILIVSAVVVGAQERKKSA